MFLTFALVWVLLFEVDLAVAVATLELSLLCVSRHHQSFEQLLETTHEKRVTSNMKGSRDGWPPQPIHSDTEIRKLLLFSLNEFIIDQFQTFSW
jgi:hypothetical protein